MRRRGRRKGLTTFAAGLIGLIVIVAFTYLGFTKFKLPFVSQGTTVQAMFLNANQLRPGSLVRMAGVNVGKVTSVDPAPGCSANDQSKCQAALVTMNVNDQALPLHKDATFAIRPRIFLEGNFFVDVRPGSPSAPIAASGFVFPPQQGTQPVQLDQILTSLQSDTRHNLQILLQQLGTGLKQGGPAYNRSVQYWLPAYEYSAIVAHDALGLQPHDLSNWINEQGQVAGALDTHPQNLESLITDFNRTANAFATQNVALENAVAELPKTLSAALPALTSLNADFCSGAQVPGCAPGPLPKLATALIPAVKSTGPMIDKSLPFITQLRLLVQPSELGGLTTDLAATVPALAKLTIETIPFMRNQVRPAASCVANVVYPWTQTTLNDPHFNASNGFPPHKVYVEAVDFLPGLAGESRNFDANGPYVRVLGALGNTAVTSLQSGLIGGELAPIVGEQPQVPPGGKRPPLAGGDIPNYACETQPPVTDLSAPSGPTPPTYTAGGLLPPGLLPLPPLPVGLSRDRATTGGSSQSENVKQETQSQQQQRQALEKTGLFEVARHPSSGSNGDSSSSAADPGANGSAKR